eukprot:9874909-Ditylum_brightwellii.AAC.1
MPTPATMPDKRLRLSLTQMMILSLLKSTERPRRMVGGRNYPEEVSTNLLTSNSLAAVSILLWAAAADTS